MKKYFSASLSSVTLLLVMSSYTYASPTTSTMGISGDVDLKNRGPILTFSKDVFSDSSRILVDAHVDNDGYSKYPIRFDFYINGKLLLSQFRSKELSTPVGLTLSRSEYPLPYNYTIVATLVTPNRNFTTTAYGAIDGTELAVSLPCTLLIKNEDESTTSYSSDSVAMNSSSDSSLSISFTGTDSATADTKSVSVDLSLTGTAATGTMAVGDAAATNVSGTVSYTEGSLSEVTIESTAGDSVSCGSSGTSQ